MTTTTATVDVWDRRRLQRTLAGVTALVVLLLAGLAYAVQAALTTEPQTASTQAAAVSRPATFAENVAMTRP